ncbi:MAG: hypothetical protein IPK80_03470 [Nannocystis sp.]|nr:hypothetical protein [Nannocystis sp.]
MTCAIVRFMQHRLAPRRSYDPTLLRRVAAALALAAAGCGEEAEGGGFSGTSITGASASITGASATTSSSSGETGETSASGDTGATSTGPGGSSGAATSGSTTTNGTSGGEPAECGAIAATPGWQLCASDVGTCEGVFTDGAGCQAMCAAVGMTCAEVYEDLDGACAPDLDRPPLGCDPPSGHKSDYCVCVSDPEGCVPSCAGKTCGGDGCGGSCGGCEAGSTCQAGACVGECDAYPFPAASLLAERVGFGAQATGGDPAKVYLVTTLADSGEGSLRAALESDEPYWIAFAVEGTIKISGDGRRISVRSNKTIDGRGRDVTVNGNLRLSDARNVIISDIRLKNDQEAMCGQEGDVLLLIGEGGADPASYTTRDVWIHHVDLFSGGDGLLDLRGASRVTLSWSHLHDHNKAMLMWQTRSGKPATGMRVTLHHNFLDRLTLRGPQFIYGWLHFFNNYHFEWYEYGAGSLGGAQMLSERNVYRARPGQFCIDCPDPNPCGGNDLVVSKEAVVNEWASNGKGFVRSVGDSAREGAKIAASSPEKVFDPAGLYEYTADPADDALVAAIVAGAGPRVDYCGG